MDFRDILQCCLELEIYDAINVSIYCDFSNPKSRPPPLCIQAFNFNIYNL